MHHRKLDAPYGYQLISLRALRSTNAQFLRALPKFLGQRLSMNPCLSWFLQTLYLSEVKMRPRFLSANPRGCGSAHRDICGLIPPVLTSWSIPPGELTPWPPQHRSKPTAAMPRRAPGPKPRGERPARRNAITHSMTARTIMPVLPQEDPKELEDRTQQAIAAMKPRNPLEHDLVCPRCGWRGSSIAPNGSGRLTWPTGSEWMRDRGRTRSARMSSAGFTTSAASCFFGMVQNACHSGDSSGPLDGSGVLQRLLPAAERRNFIAWRREPQGRCRRERTTNPLDPNPKRGRQLNASRTWGRL